MRATEFIKEGVDTSPEDVEQNHPEIYKFVTNITGPYTPEKAKVNSFDLGNTHYVVLNMGPSASLDNTRAVMKSKGIGFDNRSENELIGEHNDLRFTIRQDKKGPGNNRQTWQFEMPKAVQEAMFEGGSNAEELIAQYNQENMMAGGSEASLTGPDRVTVQSLDDWEDMFIGSVSDFEQWMNGMSEAEETKWDYVCPSGHHTPYEGPGAPEFTVRPCPQCGLKARATKQTAVNEAEPVAKPKKRKRFQNPFGPMHDEEPSFFNRAPQRNTNRDDDDDSHGLSNGDRNR